MGVRVASWQDGEETFFLPPYHRERSEPLPNQLSPRARRV